MFVVDLLCYLGSVGRYTNPSGVTPMRRALSPAQPLSVRSRTQLEIHQIYFYGHFPIVIQRNAERDRLPHNSRVCAPIGDKPRTNFCVGDDLPTGFQRYMRSESQRGCLPQHCKKPVIDRSMSWFAHRICKVNQNLICKVICMGWLLQNHKKLAIDRSVWWFPT